MLKSRGGSTNSSRGGGGFWAGILQGGGGGLGSSKRQVRGNFHTDKQTAKKSWGVKPPNPPPFGSATEKPTLWAGLSLMTVCGRRFIMRAYAVQHSVGVVAQWSC